MPLAGLKGVERLPQFRQNNSTMGWLAGLLTGVSGGLLDSCFLTRAPRTSVLHIGSTGAHLLARRQQYPSIWSIQSGGLYVRRSPLHGSVNVEAFPRFAKVKVLSKCNSPDGKNSILVLDNASLYHTRAPKTVRQEANVKLAYLPPYLPDYNPI